MWGRGPPKLLRRIGRRKWLGGGKKVTERLGEDFEDFGEKINWGLKKKRSGGGKEGKRRNTPKRKMESDYPRLSKTVNQVSTGKTGKGLTKGWEDKTSVGGSKSVSTNATLPTLIRTRFLDMLQKGSCGERRELGQGREGKESQKLAVP